MDYFKKKPGNTFPLVLKGRNKTMANNTWLTRNPTGNCQLNIFGYANQVLLHASDESTKKIFQEIFLKTATSLVLIDVHRSETYNAKIIRVFGKKNIKMKSNYVSSNDSLMCIYILKINNL